jgi:hypothetical protein
MSQIKISLESYESDALQKLARFEKRDTRQQAAILIRQQLEALGWLQSITPTTSLKESGNDLQIQHG